MTDEEVKQTTMTPPVIVDDIKDDTISKLKKENEELEFELKKKESLIAKMQELKNRELVQGRANAGIPQKQETEQEKWAREAKKRYEGTGLDPT